MATRTDLLSLHEELYVEIRAAEDWHDSYKKHPDIFRALVMLEGSLQTAVAEYLKGASNRADSFVDWTVLKADSGVPNASDEVWDEERRLLTVAVLELVTQMTGLGVEHGSAESAMGEDVDSLWDAVMKAAREQVAQFVRGATDTTRKLIRESVAQSIALGEDRRDATERLMKVIDNPMRAMTIAQTEPVNAFQGGYNLYAKKTGAVSKEWDGLAGACQICSPLIGTTVDIDEKFILSNGKEIDYPAGHPRCRCSLIYNY